MDQTSALRIRNANFDDMKMFLEWANDQSWNQSEADVAFYHIDPQGFFVGEVNGESAAIISSVAYDNYAHIAFYVVKTEFRGKGYGLQLFKHALKYAEEKAEVLGLDGVEYEVKNYEKWGFKPVDLLVRYKGKAQGKRSDELLDLHRVPLEEITTYDQNNFGSSRKNFIETLLRQQDVHGFAVKENGKIRGYGILKKSHTGYKVAPLVADNQQVAEQILAGLQSLIEGEDIYLDIFEANKDAENLVKSQGWIPVWTLNRMYKNGLPKNDTKKLYGNFPEIA